MPEELIKNEILASLPRAEYERILPALDLEQWKSGKTLYMAGETIAAVYFATNSMVSLVSLTEEGGSIEVGVIGKEGMVGVSAVLGSHRMSQDAIVQLPGDALRLDMKVLTDELGREGRLQGLLLRHMHLLHFQVARSVLCNRFHAVAPRMCRWLLMSRDRAGSDELHLTQEFVATMLGVARPVVSVTSRSIRDAGLIEYRMGRIRILDLEGLKKAACDCYEYVRNESTAFPSN